MARYAGNNVVLVEAIKEHQCLTTELGEADFQDLALACDRVIAEFALHADPTMYDRQVRFFVRNPMLDSARRAISAKILLASADAHCDRPMAESAFQDLQSIVPDTTEASSNIDQAALIYHSTFGDRNAVAQLSARVFREAQRIDGWIDCPRIMAAAMALRIATDDREHIELLERAHGILMTRGMSRLCSKLSAQIGSAYLDDGEIDSAQYWLTCASRHCSEFRDMPLSADHIALVADLALLRGDLKAARDAVISMSRNCPLFAAPRFRMALLAYDVRLSVAEGKSPDDVSLATISRWHEKASAFGRHDDIMDALFIGLSSKGNGTLAEKLLRSYVVDERREVRPCNFMLGSRIAHLPEFSRHIRDAQATNAPLY